MPQGKLTIIIEAASAKTETIDFTQITITAATVISADDLTAAIAGILASDTDFTSVTTATNIYTNNTSSGQFQGTNLIKTGSRSAAGKLVLKFGETISQVDITCHAWDGSASDTVTVNGDTKNASTSGTATKLSFILDEASDTITIDFANRVFVFDITVTYGAGCQHTFGNYTDTAGQTHTGTCTICGKVKTVAHTYSDGVCVCGAIEPAKYDITVSYTVGGVAANDLPADVTVSWVDEEGDATTELTNLYVGTVRKLNVSAKGYRVVVTVAGESYTLGSAITITDSNLAVAIAFTAIQETEVSITAFTAKSGNVGSGNTITYATAQGNGTTAPAVGSNVITLYKPASGNSTGGKLTITAATGYKITSVTVEFAQDKNSSVVYSVDGGANSANQDVSSKKAVSIEILNIDATTVVFYVTGGDRVKLAGITVTYVEE